MNDSVEYLPSTTRAVAWGAMFFAFLSFLISVATLLLTYRDGVMARNLENLLGEARQTIAATRAKAPAVDLSDMAERVNVRDQLDRYAKMVQDKDKQAVYYLQNLREDLTRLQAYRPKEAAAWLGDAMHAVDAATSQLRDNAPEAARNLRAMADKINVSVRGAAAKAAATVPAVELPRKAPVTDDARTNIP